MIIRFLITRESFLNGEKRKGHGKEGDIYREGGEGLTGETPDAVGEDSWGQVNRYIVAVVQVAPDDGLNESNENEEGNPLWDKEAVTRKSNPHRDQEVAMYIVVEHVISDPDAFFGVAEKVAAAPPGYTALQFCPSTSKDRAVCLWEAKSVDALKGFLDPVIGKSSRNTYYAVDSTKAMGLPIKKAAA